MATSPAHTFFLLPPRLLVDPEELRVPDSETGSDDGEWAIVDGVATGPPSAAGERRWMDRCDG